MLQVRSATATNRSAANLTEQKRHPNLKKELGGLQIILGEQQQFITAQQKLNEKQQQIIEAQQKKKEEQQQEIKSLQKQYEEQEEQIGALLKQIEEQQKPNPE